MTSVAQKTSAIETIAGVILNRRLTSLEENAIRQASELLFGADDSRVAETRAVKVPETKDVYQMLSYLGVPSHIKGMKYLVSAIMICISDNSAIEKMTKVLYPAIAKEFETTASRVERSIRHAIECAWDRGDIDVHAAVFGSTISLSKGKPTNGEFIALIADGFMNGMFPLKTPVV